MEYKITVKSHINPGRIQEFGQLEVEHLSNGCSLLHGQLADQAQLYALLIRLRDMGVDLLQIVSHTSPESL